MLSATAVSDVVIKTEPVDVENSPYPPPHRTPSREPSPAVAHTSSWELACWARSARSKTGQTMAPPELLVCEVCQAEFPNFEILLLHKLCHFNTRHVCYVCDCYFASTDSLVVHIATIHHNLSKASGYYKAEAERAFSCCICLQRFSSNKMLDHHLNTHLVNDENSFSCKVCAVSFTSYTALLTHLNTAEHKDMKVKLQSIFVCFDCRRVFATRDSYAMHMMLRAQTETCDTIREPMAVDLKPENSAATMQPDVPELALLQARRLLSPSASSPPGYGTVATRHPATPLTCIVCWTVLESCDALAMHMMERHAYRKQGSVEQPRRPASENAQSNGHATSPDSTKRKLSATDHETVTTKHRKSSSSGQISQERKDSLKERENVVKDSKSEEEDHGTKTENDEPTAAACDDTTEDMGRGIKTRANTPQSPESSNLPEETSEAGSSVTSACPSMLCLMQSHGELGGGDVLDYVLANIHSISMCKYCKIIFTNRTIFYLHMGLHNLNNPWQCNLCGKVCRDLHDFSSHVIHF